MSTETLSIRIDSAMKEKLEALAEQTQRSKSFLAAEAIAAYVELESWQIGEIEAGIADDETGRVVNHEEVKKWLSGWGTKERPKARR
jgi:RHH-type transcriptional regulator, rel operon repressor / antitoxin RelB